MKQIYSLVILGIVTIIGCLSIAPAEAQECKAKAMGDRDGFVVDQNMKAGLKKIEGKMSLYLTPRKGQKSFPVLRVRVGEMVNPTPDVPLTSYVVETKGEFSAKYNEKKKQYLVPVESALREIARSTTRVGYLEVNHEVNVGGSVLKAPLANPLKITCKAMAEDR